MIHLGIDPGADGAMAAVTDSGQIVWMRPFPKLKGKATPHGIHEILAGFLASLGDTPAHVWLEKVQAPMLGAKQKGSSTSVFSFGKNAGWCEMAAVANGVGYTLVSPKVWQRRMWQGTDGSLSNKQRSVQAAQRIWPGVDFTKSERATKPHDGLCEAALIALYGVQKWKGE